jgi:hypothetical protein
MSRGIGTAIGGAATARVESSGSAGRRSRCGFSVAAGDEQATNQKEEHEASERETNGI